jgi:hypothetical protein
MSKRSKKSKIPQTPQSIQQGEGALLFAKYGEKVFTCIFAVFIAIGILIRIAHYAATRSLWLDEAMLAENIVNRGWLELLTPPLSNGQSAPVFYVVAVKAICSVLGYSEFSLRIFSMFSFIGLLICEVALLKKAFNLDIYKIAAVAAITALLPAYIFYSNELKPYMGDAFFAVLTLLLYSLYQQKKLNLRALTALYIVIIGFSTPAVFFIGGAMLCEFISVVFGKDKRRIISVFASGAAIVAAFALYYLWWMAPAVGSMDEYWNKPGAKRITIELIRNILTPYPVKLLVSENTWFFVPFTLLGIYYLVRSKNKIAYAVIISFSLLLFAVLIGKWPLTFRLWLFLPAFILLLFPFGFDFIAKRYKMLGNIGFLVLTGIVIYQLTAGCFKYANGLYLPRQEVNLLISYVRKNIKEGEKVYVYQPATYTFRFKNGYNTAKIGNVAADNVIYGKERAEWNEEALKTEPGGELRSILENDKGVYLIFSHYHTGINPGLNILLEYGELTQIVNVHNTPLFYFQKPSKIAP